MSLITIDSKTLIRYAFEKVYRENSKNVLVKSVTCSAQLGKIEGDKISYGESFSAFANCSLKDNFNFLTGAKLSLLRVMKKLGLEEKERASVWEVFLARTQTREDREKEVSSMVKNMSSEEFEALYTAMKAKAEK